MFSINVYGVFRESLRISGPQHYAVGQLWIEYFLLMERQKNDYWEYIIEVNRMLFHWAKLRLFYIFNLLFIECAFLSWTQKRIAILILANLYRHSRRNPVAGPEMKNFFVL